MSLADSPLRRNVFTVATEGRLYRTDVGVYLLASDEGGSSIEATTGFTTAAEELLTDECLLVGDPDSEGTVPLTVTTVGYALLAEWNGA